MSSGNRINNVMGLVQRFISFIRSRVESIFDPEPTGRDRRRLYVFDFDRTIIHHDSHVAISDLREGRPTPDHILHEYYTGNQMAYFQRLMDHIILEERISLEEILESLKQTPILPGMKQLLHQIMQATAAKPNTHFIVISGCNTLFVEHYLRSLEPAVLPHKIISNLAVRVETPEPRLAFAAYENQTVCRLCSRCICKGRALAKYIAEHGSFSTVFYAGDGCNDLCPAMRLRACDLLFVRRGYSLHNVISSGFYKGVPVVVSAKIHYFSTGFDIESVMKF